jgi:hypothetical protein
MRKMAATLAFALAAVPAFADHSRPRGGGGGGGGSSHPSGGSGGASSSSGGSSSGDSTSASPYSGGGGRDGSRPLTPAQARHPRAGTGSGYNYYHGGGYYPGYYPWYPWYYPASYYYGPYWGAYYYGYWPYGAYYGGYANGSGAYSYGSGGGEGGEAYYHSGGHSEPGAVRVLVDPDDAKVYVDGYYAGKVEQFDGMFQRLNLQRGRHEILISKDGYQGQRFLVYSYPGASIKIESSLSKGSGEAPVKDLTGGRGGDGPETRPAMDPDADDDPASDWPEDGARTSAPRHESTSTRRAPTGERLGEVRMNVQPADATVYVDGEFRGTARETANLVLPSGPHRIEIVRPGFRTETREVDVRAGETQAVVVELDRP